jgi:hypothetical protein
LLAYVQYTLCIFLTGAERSGEHCFVSETQAAGVVEYLGTWRCILAKV